MSRDTSLRGIIGRALMLATVAVGMMVVAWILLVGVLFFFSSAWHFVSSMTAGG